MDEPETDPDPRRRIPTLPWVMLGAVVLLVFILGIILVGRPHPTHAVGPPAGAPPDQSALTAPPLPAPMPH
jgi:hypothetical protein